jgi:predicted phage terminase large subunit-like protein
MLIRPQPKQEEFLTTDADIALYGGSAGGGKSFSLLLAPLYHIDNPKFNAVFFRRSIVQIRNQGGLWDESMSLYHDADGHPRQQFLDWTFPSGAVVKFAHLENDSTVYNWQGSAINLLIYDELTHFSAHQFFYMLSRNRSISGIKPYIRMSTNPDKDSWVRKFIDWWIGEDGFPIPERSGVIRYFVRESGKIIWADTPEELSHVAEAKSFTFISAKLTDNQILMQKDPGYLSNLMAQNMVERAKLLDGNWNISYSDIGSVLNRNHFDRYNLPEKWKIPGFWKESYFVLDGASRTAEANDYSVLGLFGRSRIDERWYIIDWVRTKLEEPDLEQLIIDKWHQWRSPQYNNLNPKGINIERGSCGIGMLQRLPRKGIPVFELQPVKDKYLRLNDGLGIIHNKFVCIPDDASWAHKFFEECECFRADMKHVLMENESKPHDDQVDVLAYGISTQINKTKGVGIYVAPIERKFKRSPVYD